MLILFLSHWMRSAFALLSSKTNIRFDEVHVRLSVFIANYWLVPSYCWIANYPSAVIRRAS